MPDQNKQYEYFKDQDSKAELENIIKLTTEKNTKEILSFFHDNTDWIKGDIDEIDKHIGASADPTNIPTFGMDQLINDLHIHIGKTTKVLENYDSSHALFHDKLKQWMTFSEKFEKLAKKIKDRKEAEEEEAKDRAKGRIIEEKSEEEIEKELSEKNKMLENWEITKKFFYEFSSDLSKTIEDDSDDIEI